MGGLVSGKNVTVQTWILIALLTALLLSRLFLQNILIETFLILFITGSVLFVFRFHKERAREAIEKASGSLAENKYTDMLKREVGHTDEVLASIISEIAREFAALAPSLEELVTYGRQVSTKSDQISLGADAQTFSLEETARSVEGISVSIKNLVEMVERLFPHAERATSSIMEMVDSNKKISKSSQELLGQVKEVSSDIDDMVGSVKVMEKRFVELSSSSLSTSGAVQRIDTTIKDIEEKAGLSLELSEQVRRDAEMGAASSSKTIEGMNHIKDIVSESSKVIEKLGQKSGEIGEIINVIDEVTDRTNLLALNASIIAAQAGEHGRGFAVVAGEIKKLAEQTAASTIEISGLIKGIQSMVADAVQANELGTWSVEEGVRLSHESGEALRKILESTKKASEMSRLIAEATVNQSDEARSVLDSIREEVNVIQGAASAMRAHAGRSERIKGSASRMVAITQEVARANVEQEKANAYVTKAIEEVKLLVKGMFDVTRTQKSDSDQIMQAIEIISFISSENIKGIKELSSGIRELREKLERFNKEFEEMKL